MMRYRCVPDGAGRLKTGDFSDDQGVGAVREDLLVLMRSRAL